MIYPADIIDEPQEKRQGPKNLQPSVEPVSHISGATENIMRDPPAASSHQSPDPEDEIPQLTQGTLNLIGRAVNTAVTRAVDRAMNQRLGPEHRRPVVEVEDPTSDTRDIREKDWRPEEIGFFCDESGPVVTINRHIYYRDVYAFINRLKDVALLRSMEKTRTVLPELQRGSALIWHSTELSVTEKEMLRMVPLDYWYTRLIARFKERAPDALS